MTTITQLVNPQEFGIEPQKANEIMGNLPQIKAERSILEDQYENIIKLDIEEAETPKLARELRLAIVKNRTQGINVWHKNTKEFFLKGGQFVDAIKRLEAQVNERMEETLEKIEKHAEIKEAQKREELRQIRLKELELYLEFVPSVSNLGNLTDQEYSIVFNGAKLQYEAKIAEQARLEAERLQQERLQNELQTRQKELAPYQFYAETTVVLGMSEDDYLQLLEDAKNAKAKDDAEKEKQRKENERLRKEAEIKAKELEAERKKQAEKEAKLKAEAEAKLRAEQQARAKLEAEIKAKKEAEAEAERQRQIKIQAEKKEAEKLAKAPIKDKLNVWVDAFNLPETSVDNETTKVIIEKFEAFKNWSKTQIQNL